MKGAASVPDGSISPAEERFSTGYTASADVVALSTEHAAEAEAIRSMRTHVIARHLEEGRRGVVMTGPTAGVGCTFAAVNLAVSLAQIGANTLLIDADLRAPAVHEFLTPPREPQGVKQLLEAGGSGYGRRDFIHPNVIPDLSVLYAGGAAPNAQELLGTDTFRDLIQGCLRDFDVTIVDSPPAIIFADARRVGTLVGYSLIVARADVSKMSDIKALANQLSEDGVQVIGTVLREGA